MKILIKMFLDLVRRHLYFTCCFYQGCLRMKSFVCASICLLTMLATGVGAQQMAPVPPMNGGNQPPADKPKAQATLPSLVFTVTPQANRDTLQLTMPFREDGKAELWQSIMSLKRNQKLLTKPTNDDLHDRIVGGARQPADGGAPAFIELKHTPQQFKADVTDMVKQMVVGSVKAKEQILTTDIPEKQGPRIVNGEMSGMSAEFFNGPNEILEAEGSLEMRYKFVKKPADDENLVVDVQVKDPTIVGNARILYKVVIEQTKTGKNDWKQVGEVGGPQIGKWIVLDKGAAGKDHDNKFSAVLGWRHGSFTFTEVRVRIEAKVQAADKPLEAPGLPEPATWVLGLTGLAAVVGTQAWKKRYPKSAV
jgi:hypothetical protein